MAASRHQILCVNKTDRQNPHERIRNIGGKNANGENWRISQQEAIEAIEAKKWNFYVTVNGKTVDVIVAVSRYGNKYIKTTSDGDQPNNLLSLHECE